MKNLMMALAAVVLVNGTVTATPLRVMTYNIRSGSGTQNTHLFGLSFFYGHGDKYLDRIADKAKDLGADILCMQEVQGRSLRSLGYDQTGHIAKRLGNFHHVWACAKSQELIVNRQGNAIVSRWPILESRTVVLNESHGDVEERIALLARVVFPDAGPKGLWVISTHLFQREDDTIRQAELAVLAKAMAGVDGPLVVCGDFNARPDSVSVQQVLAGSLGRPLFDALAETPNAGELTSNSLVPTARIDYVFHDASIKTLTASVPAQSPGDSDHRPVITELQLSPAPAIAAQAVAAPRAESGPDFDGLNQ